MKEIVEKDFAGKVEFLAQNVKTTDFGDPVFKPYAMRTLGGVPVAVIGQAFPYTPIANPRYFVPEWTFGIQDDNLQKVIDEARGKGAQVVVLLSHNGMDVDLKLASRVRGLDAILGGHTHDGMPQPTVVSNRGGKTLVTNAGSNGKFLGVLDLAVKDGKVADYRYRLLPVFSNLLPADPAMEAHIAKVREPYKARLEQKLATADDLLYRRGNFNGTFDQLICDALMAEKGAEIAFSPGFRWGTTVLPGQAITMEHVLDQTAITYPYTTVSELTGETIKTILEDVADNLFNPDPYYQQGGDMVRVGGLQYAIDPRAAAGQAHHAAWLCRARAIEADQQVQGGRLGAGLRGSESRRRRARLGPRRALPQGALHHQATQAQPAADRGRRRQSRHRLIRLVAARGNNEGDDMRTTLLSPRPGRARRRSRGTRPEARRQRSVAHHRRRAAGCAGGPRALRQGRLHRRGRGRRPRRARARLAAQRPRRRAHGPDREREGVDRAVLPHGHDRTRRDDAIRPPQQRHPRPPGGGGRRRRTHDPGEGRAGRRDRRVRRARRRGRRRLRQGRHRGDQRRAWNSSEAWRRLAGRVTPAIPRLHARSYFPSRGTTQKCTLRGPTFTVRAGFQSPMSNSCDTMRVPGLSLSSLGRSFRLSWGRR